MCGLRTSLYFHFIKIYFQALRILLCQIKHYHTIPFHGLRECQLLFLLTEHGLQDGFIVDGADEAGPHRLVQWIIDGWEVACGCHLSDPSCQFRRCLSRLPLDGAPELVTFPHRELRRVVVD